MKKLILIIMATVFIAAFAATASATLTTIGTATYLGSNYNLIWDDDNNGNSVIWLDYSNYGIWASQILWVNGLDSALTYDIDSAYTVSWDSAGWRLPSTVDGPYVYGCDGTTTAGYNIKTSEMGHLYYDELGNLGSRDVNGVHQDPHGLLNTGDFNSLIEAYYWFSTGYGNTDSAWFLGLDHGLQGYNTKSFFQYGLAIHDGTVSTVPVPAAIWLLGSGLLGLLGLRRKEG